MKEQRQLPADVVDLLSKANALVHNRDKIEDERAAKRRRLLEINNSSHSSNSEEATTGSDGCDGIDETNGDEATSGPKPPQLAPGFNIWWYSMDAQKLLNVSKEKETVVDRLEDLFAILDDANSMALSYNTVVEGHDPENTMSEHKKEVIQMKARYLAQAYRIAI